MLDKKILFKFAAIGLLAFVSACGGGDAGGVGPFVTEFKTVFATASQPTTQTVDLLTGNTCPTPTPPNGTRDSNSVTVTITITPYNTITNPLTLDIGQATVTFETLTPNAPTIAPVTAASSSFPASAGSITIPVNYFPADRKDANFNALVCNTSLSYRYNVTVTFPAFENGSNESKTIVAKFPMEIKDQP